MPNITMDDFIDECLTGKKPRRKRKRVVEESTDISSIFEADEQDDTKGKKSVVDTKDANEKTSQDDVEEQTPEDEEEQTQKKDTVLSLILNINEEKKVKNYTKETFIDVPLNFQSILKNFGLDMEQISKKASETVPGEMPQTPGDELPSTPGETTNNPESEEKPSFDKFRLSIKEFVTSGAGSERVELSWRREGDDTSAIETAEVITSNGSMPFNDSPDPLQSALATFDRIYYNDIISKIREELDAELS